MAKILLVEDDAALAKQVADWLHTEKHQIEMSAQGKDALEKLRFYQYDLVILDWQLPELSGIEILGEFRNMGGKTPVLMLTGKTSVTDKETGLDTGADDYLTKPFHMKELSARVRALVRRIEHNYEKVLRTRTIELDPRLHKVSRNGQELKLQPQEFACLEFLMRNPNDYFSAEALLNRVWPSETDASIDTVRVCITRLRNKLDPLGGPSVIKTVHRLGYQIDPEQ